MTAGRGVRRRVVATAVVLVLVPALAGCTGDGDDDEDATPAPAAPTTVTSVPPAPPDGSAIRLGVPEEPASLNPFDARSRTGAGLAILGAVLPPLFRVGPSGEVSGFLADTGSVEESADGRSVSFSLRDGVTWSDGRPVTADDLRFTLDAVRAASWPGPRAGYDRVAAVEGEGAAVTFRFDAPLPGWRRLFSGDDFVLPAHRLAGRDLAREWAAGPDLAGGPFRLGPVTPGLETTLVANENWWGAGPGVASIRVLVVPDVRTMEQLLGRGELDLAWPPVASNRVGRFGRLDGVDVSVAEPGGRLDLLVANAAQLSEGERRGLLGLVDRDRFAEVLLAGEAKPATGLEGPDGGVTWARVVPDRNPPGLDGTFEATVVGSESDPMAPLLGRLLERAGRDAGSTVELKFADPPRVDGTWLPEGGFDLAIAETVAWPDPCWRCWFDEASVGRGNLARVKDLDELAGAADAAGGASAAGTLEAAVRNQALMLPLWRPRAVLAGRGVTGAEANSWSVGPFWKVEEWARR